MLEAYVRETENATECSTADVDDRLRNLDNLLAALRQTLQDRSNRQEALTWAIDSVARLPPPPADDRCRMFCWPLAEAEARDCSSAARTYALELLRMFCDHQPAKATVILLRHRPEAIEQFFQGDGSERRITMWFGAFDASGAGRLGATALSTFALAHRANVWDLLTWRSKHPHAPVTVAAAPQYFAELDVPRTVGNLLRECPRFWASPELHATMKRGELLRLDAGFFARQLVFVLQQGGGCRGDGSGRHSGGGDGGSLRHHHFHSDGGGHSGGSRARQAADRLLADVERFVADTDHPALCRRLMHLLPEPALLRALSRAAAHLPAAASQRQPARQRSELGSHGAAAQPSARAGADGGAGGHMSAAEAAATRLIFADTRWRTLDTLLLAHAAAFKAVELWRWLHEDEECLQAAHAALSQLQRPDWLHVLWAAQRHADSRSSEEVASLLLAEKFSAHVYLHEEVQEDEAQLDQLLTMCGLSFRHIASPSDYRMLAESPRKKHKKHKAKKGSKKRKREGSSELLPADAAPAAATTWEVELQGASDQAVACSAQQLHACLALQLLANWL